jgi:hypothetical protein
MSFTGNGSATSPIAVDSGMLKVRMTFMADPQCRARSASNDETMTPWPWLTIEIVSWLVPATDGWFSWIKDCATRSARQLAGAPETKNGTIRKSYGCKLLHEA